MDILGYDMWKVKNDDIYKLLDLDLYIRYDNIAGKTTQNIILNFDFLKTKQTYKLLSDSDFLKYLPSILKLINSNNTYDINSVDKYSFDQKFVTSMIESRKLFLSIKKQYKKEFKFNLINEIYIDKKILAYMHSRIDMLNQFFENIDKKETMFNLTERNILYEIYTGMVFPCNFICDDGNKMITISFFKLLICTDFCKEFFKNNKNLR